MLIKIRVLKCEDGTAKIAAARGQECPPDALIVVRGYLPSGQELITSRIMPATQRKDAIRAVVEWLFLNRPGWSVEIDDSRTGNTQVAA